MELTEIQISQLKGETPVEERAVHCGICQSLADRYCNRFQCRANPNHVGDLIVGIFSDLTYPEDEE